MTEVRGSGQEELPRIPGALAMQAQECRDELLHVKVRRGGGEEIPIVQGKEQWLCFPGTAVKRYPTFKVKETQVRQ